MRPENERVIKELVRFLMKMESGNGFFEIVVKGENGEIKHWYETVKRM